MKIAVMFLLCVLSLFTGQGYSMQPTFSPSYGPIDAAFYKAVIAKNLTPLNRFCQKCGMALSVVHMATQGKNPDEANEILFNLGNTAHDALWWRDLVDHGLTRDFLFQADSIVYFPPDLIIQQDTQNPIDKDPIARLKLIWQYMKGANSKAVLAPDWMECAKNYDNRAAITFLNTAQTIPLPRGGRKTVLSKLTPGGGDSTGSGTSETSAVSPANNAITTDVTQSNAIDHGNTQTNTNPVTKGQNKKLAWITPSIVVGFAIVGCALCAIGGIKLYNWYHPPHEYPADEQEHPEITT